MEGNAIGSSYPLSKERILQANIKNVVKSNYLYWLLENWLISSGESKGEPYTFKNRPYLLDIAKEDDPFLVVQKSAQCGISELMVSRMCWFLDTRKLNVLYVHPSQEAMRVFATGRIKPIEDNPKLANKIADVFNTEQMKWRSSDVTGKRTANFAYFSGSRERRQMISKDVSALFIDELDEMDQSNIYTLEKRLDNAANPYKAMFSTPTIPGYGINNKFVNDSNQKQWIVKCRYCSKEQILDWESNILDFYDRAVPDAVIRCRKCHNEITTEDRLNGRFVAARNYSGLAAGYHVSKLMDIRFDANFFLSNGLDPTKMEEFYKSDLGEPYEPSGNKITAEDLDSANYQGRIVPEWREGVTTMGVDVGDKLHYRISRLKDGRAYGLNMGICNWTELYQLLPRYNVMRCVIDINPERTKAREFRSKFPGKVFLCDFNSNDRSYYQHKDDYYWISAHRTEIMTMTMEAFKTRLRLIPMDIKHKVPDYYEQLKTPVRSIRQNGRTGEMEAYFPKSSKPDHYFFAEAYDMLAGMMMSSHVTQRREGVFY